LSYEPDEVLPQNYFNGISAVVPAF